MKTATYLFLFAIVLFSAPIANSQVPTAAYDRLDSILQTGSPEAALAYWSTVCPKASENSTKTACTVTDEQLTKLIGYIALLKTQSETYANKIIDEGRNQNQAYTNSYAGPAAARAYQAFIAAADNQEPWQAITLFRTARYFKLSFLKKRLAEAHLYYEQAVSYFRVSKFESADSLLEMIDYDASHNQALLAYADTIGYLQKRVDQKLLDIQKRKFYWERTSSVDSRFSISLISKVINQPGSRSFPLLLTRANSTLLVEVDKLAATYRFGFGLKGSYRLNERISISGGYETAKFVYTSVYTTQLIFFDFDVAYSHAFLEGQYLLRSEVGLRPYINIGLGVMQFTHDQFNAVIYREVTGYETYQVAGDDFSSGEATISIGTQFVPTSSSHWAISSELTWYLPFKEHSFLPLPGVSIGMQLDYLM